MTAPAETGAVPTAGAAVDILGRRFAAAGIETPRLDARLLVAAALGVSVDRLRSHPETPVPAAARADLMAFARRRAEAREPVSRLLGRREFWSREFLLSPAVLDPRPDSETLVAAALDHLADKTVPARVLDLGTGSGCLMLSVLAERPAATGVGTDTSVAALAVARANADRLGLAARAHFVRADWAGGIDGRFDVLLCNPPYIPSGDITSLAPEVRDHDPRGALDGGPDGLDAFRALAPHLAELLTPGGVALLEFGDGQGPAVQRLLDPAGARTVTLRQDLAGRDRCAILRPPGP